MISSHLHRLYRMVFFTIGVFLVSSSPLPIHAQSPCLTWHIGVNAQDSRVNATLINAGSGADCRGSVRFANGTGLPLIGGGYTLELQAHNIQNANLQWIPMADLLPSLDIQLHALPIVVSAPAQVLIHGKMTLRSWIWDASLFLLRTALALEPIGVSCWIPEEQLVYSAVRVSSIVGATTSLAADGDWIGARQEFSQVADEFYTRAGEVLKDAGVGCAFDVLKKKAKTPVIIARISLAFLTWMPVAIFDYFYYQGRPVELELEYDSLVPQNGGGSVEFAFTAAMGNGMYRIYALRRANRGETPILLTPTMNAWHPALSKDGKWVAFESAANNETQIFLMDANGNNIRQLTSGSTPSFRPAFSPDGQQIVFASEREGDTQIFVMNINGSKQRKLTAMPSLNFAPEYSLSSNYITFASYRDGSEAEVYIMNADGTNQRRLTNNLIEDEKPCFMTGDQIIYHSKRSGHYEIYAMNRDGSNVQQLTRHPDNRDNFQPACSTSRLMAYAHIEGTMPHIVIRDLGTGVEWTVPTVGTQGELGPAWQR